ncbi:hypothetical protein OWR28_07385 [Chryseobacterium sp. 1B4]
MKAIERIYEYIDYKGIKAISFERSIGLSNGYLGKQLKRKADLGESILIKIIDNCPDINPLWLITGSGKMLETGNTHFSQGISEANHSNIRLPFEKTIAPPETVAEKEAVYGKTQTDPLLVHALNEHLNEQKLLYIRQIQLLNVQIEMLTKDKEERIQEYRDRISELKEYIEILKNMPPPDVIH